VFAYTQLNIRLELKYPTGKMQFRDNGERFLQIHFLVEISRNFKQN